MADYDLFELTGISPDEIKAATVKSLLDKKDKELREKLGMVSQDTERNEINAQIAFLAQKRGEILDSAQKKLTDEFRTLAKAKIANLRQRLTARILLEKQGRAGRELVITNGRIKRIRQSRIKLSEKDIEKLYVDNGFKVEKIEPSKAMPVFPSNRENIAKEIESLKQKVRKAKTLNPQLPDADFIKDLYDFAAYVSDDVENAKDYRTFSTKQLKSILEAIKQKYIQMNSETVEKTESNIAGFAVLYVFDSDAHRKGYDQYLLYSSPVLTELFTNMKGLSEADLRDPDIAELCIKEIEKVFGDHDVALAIYNNEAGFRNDPYIPDRSVFVVRCAHCQAICEFFSPNEAQKLNKCTNCGEKLYKKCPKGHNVLMSLMKCPDCGYDFPDSAKFVKFMARAESALRLNDFTGARLALDQARMADTTETAKTSALEAKISKAEKDYNEPVEKLNDLMKSLKFEEASRFADVVAMSRPDINISVQRKKISDVLNECKRIFTTAKNDVDKVNSCLDILKKCSDFKLAHDFLAITPPAPCKTLKITANTEKNEAILSWDNTGEREVKYALVRKKGTKPPANEKDGECLLNDSIEFSFKDTRLEAGAIYSYSIFAKRIARYSAPQSASISILTKISDVQFSQKGRKLYISWPVPANCAGVSVSYQVGGVEKVLSSNTANSAVLDDVVLNQRYTFIFKAMYVGLGYSDASRFSFTPTAEIRDFSIDCRHMKDNIYEFSWSITESGIDVQILSGDEVLKRIRSEMRSCQINLAANKYHVIKAQASSGGNLISSINTVKINTYKACAIDNQRTSIDETVISDFAGGSSHKITISLFLSENPPANLKSFAYFIRTDGTWADEHEVRAKNSDVKIVDAAAWRQNRVIEIALQASSEDKYYLTLFAIYDNGRTEAISAPCRKILQRPVKAMVFWKIQSPLFGKRKLVLKIEANRPLTQRPGLVLCTSSTEGIPVLNLKDAHAVKVLEIPPADFDSSQENISETFDITASLRKGQYVNLFVKEAEIGKNFDVRWDSGFGGTV
ncbi:MAG: hypothetical protein IJU31_01845 [Synergistaceae bacterium]|nr:hypothetical protein [Synergistaceae bacterium]